MNKLNPEVFENNVFQVGSDGVFVDMKLKLAPGATDYAVVNPIDEFVTFSVQFDRWSGGPPATHDGESISWMESLYSNKGKWFHVLEVMNKSSVTVTVIVRVRPLP